MSAARLALATLAVASSLAAGKDRPAVASVYSSATIVNAATGLPGGFAANSMVSVYGTNLSYDTAAAPAGQNVLPIKLAGVSVLLGGTLANLYYVSPGQVNFLIPAELEPGPLVLRMVRDGLYGPSVTLTLTETAPGLFQLSSDTVIATHTDGSLLSAAAPASPGEVVILYAAGLGRTSPDVLSGQASSGAISILHLKDLSVLLDNVAVDRSLILYAGIAPGFAGLYQINLRLPATLSANPEIRIFIGAQSSPSFLKLPVHLQ
ncbi:MAG: hypothetical protein M3Z09_18170 [Acidobacteriota bacterium]|nr:hypothetical protein [Acidobacteriota bacterium]